MKICESEINNSILQLSKAITAFDSDVSIIQFGSSVYKEVKGCSDIDILLLSKKNYVKANFSAELNDLKTNLLTGKCNSSFKLNATEIEEIIIAYLNNHNTSSLKFRPAFVFGPYTISSLDEQSESVHLHFKGPLTYEQFINFCEKFPFHAKSIINNSKIIYGSFDKDYFNLFANPTPQEFLFLIDAQKIRVEGSFSKKEVFKCIKKILQNYYILEGHFTISDFELFKKVRNDFGLNPNSLTRSNLSYLKKSFFILSSDLQKSALYN